MHVQKDICEVHNGRGTTSTAYVKKMDGKAVPNQRKFVRRSGKQAGGTCEWNTLVWHHLSISPINSPISCAYKFFHRRCIRQVST